MISDSMLRWGGGGELYSISYALINLSEHNLYTIRFSKANCSCVLVPVSNR